MQLDAQVWAKPLTVSTFDDVILWARWADQEYRRRLETAPSPRSARVWLALVVHDFAVQIERQGLMDRVHSSVVRRSSALRVTKRSGFAIILLLLSLLSQDRYPRWLRFNIAAKLSRARSAGVKRHDLEGWIIGSSGEFRSA